MVLGRKSGLYIPLLTAAAFDADWQAKALNTNPEVAMLQLSFVSYIFKHVSVENFDICRAARRWFIVWAVRFAPDHLRSSELLCARQQRQGYSLILNMMGT